MSTDNSGNKRRHFFISHHFADDAEVDRLTALLKRSGHEVRNSSIRAKAANQRRLERGEVKDETIRRLLRMKISWAGRVVVLIGRQTHQRSWVDWEIRQANKPGKRIVGVYIRGATEADLPPALNDYASAIVGWSSKTVIAAINGEANPFERPDGTPRPAAHEDTRVSCS